MEGRPPGIRQGGGASGVRCACWAVWAASPGVRLWPGRAHLGSFLLALGLLPHQLQLPPQPAQLRVPHKQGLRDTGGTPEQAGGSDKRLSGALGVTAPTPGQRALGAGSPSEAAESRGGGSRLLPAPVPAQGTPPPAPAQYLLFPSVGQGASWTTSSLEPHTHPWHRAGTTGRS